MLLFIILYLLLLSIAISKWCWAKCTSKVCLVGKTAIVTGGNSGIGFETCLNLASRGCRVIIADKDDSTNSVNLIKHITDNPNVLYKHLNLASLQSVKEFAQDIIKTEERLDILVNNAGNYNLNLEYTEDGLQDCMQVNYFGPFLLTRLLIDILKKSAQSRVIFTSSLVAFGAPLTTKNLHGPSNYYDTFGFSTGIYGNSKLAQIIACNVFAQKYKDSPITFNSLHPGFARTNIFTNTPFLRGKIYKWFCYIWGKSAAQAAQTIFYLAVAKNLRYVTGQFFVECMPFIMPRKATDKEFASAIWEETEKLLNLMDLD